METVVTVASVATVATVATVVASEMEGIVAEKDHDENRVTVEASEDAV